jgi:purine-binding chemotaxis protein CheW
MSNLYVLFRVEHAEYVLSSSDVLHMESFTGATHVPGTPAYVSGLAQIRRRVVPVVDLRLRFGLPAVEPTIDSRVIVVQCGERQVGLLVDSAREVARLDADQFRPPPELVVQQAAGYVTSVAQHGARLLMLVDFRKIIGEDIPHGN